MTSDNLGKIKYSLFGVEGSAAGYATVYYTVLEKLLQRDPYLLGRLEELLVVKPANTKQFSRKRSLVHNADRAKQLTPGLWVNTQLTREVIISILTVVCDEADIPFGKRFGLWIEGMEKFQSDGNEHDPQAGQDSETSNKKKSENRGRIKYSFLGVEGVAAGYRTVYYEVLDELTKKDMSILERTENILVDHKKRLGRFEKQFSRTRSEVHWPERAKRYKHGWWLNTQFGRGGAICYLTVLCLAANIPFGKKSGLWLEGMEKFQTGQFPYDISSLDESK